MTSNEVPGSAVERIFVDHTVAKRLGNWTAAGSFEVRARGGLVVLDLRSANIPDEVEVTLDLTRTTVKLLVPEGSPIDHWELQWTAKGRVKDGQGPSGKDARRIKLVGTATNSEIRIHRGGVAMVSAMLSREYLDDLRASRKENRYPTVDDPTRDPHRDSA